MELWNVSLQEIPLVQIQFFLTFMVDMKNIGVSSRNTFQSDKKCRKFGIIFQSTIF